VSTLRRAIVRQLRLVAGRWTFGGPEPRSSRSESSGPSARTRRIVSICLATWFAVISAMRLAVLVRHGEPGFDGRLYIEASRVWLAGGDPWDVRLNGTAYAAPPPSLLPTAPLVALPVQIAIGLIVGAGLIGTWWALRRLGLPVWWLLFPPFVDGLWNANTQVLILPLIVAGSAGGAAATIFKAYAAVPLVLLGRVRAVALAAAAVAVTVPVLPWSIYVRRFGEISRTLEAQSQGGMSATTSWVLIAIAVLALVLVGRRRAAWLAVPGMWPSTQWYYASLGIPGLTPIAAALMAIPVQGATVVALVAAAVEVSAPGWMDKSWPARFSS
jgi:hypothetical protein